MKRFKILLIILLGLVLFPFNSVAEDNTAIIQEDLTITMPDLLYNGSLFGWKITFDYIGSYEGKHYWVLSNMVENKPDHNVDGYGFESSKFVEEINKARSNGAPCSVGGLNNIKWSDELSQAALNHALDMAKNDFFEHEGSDGSQFWERVGDTGFKGRPLGENIAAGSKTVEEAVNQWLNSHGHCNNIMNSRVTHMGYAYVLEHGTKWTYYHCMVTGHK